MNIRSRKYLLSGLLAVAATLMAGLLVEALLRAVVHGHLDLFASKLRQPKLYAGWFDENFWKLHVQMQGQYKPPEHPHPKLGWVGSFDRTTLIHDQAPDMGERLPVLLYGDSFAACVTDKKFQDLLNSDSEFSKTHYLLNYGVGGYGLGQISLLLKNTITLYEKPMVILSFMMLDLDRTIMPFRTGQKPFFRVVDGAVQQMAINIDPDPYHFLELNPPRISCYSLSLLNSVLGVVDRDPDPEEIKAVTTYLLREAISTLRDHHVPFLVVVFHPDKEGASTYIFDAEESWRSQVVYETLSDLDAPFVSTRKLIHDDAERKGRQLRSDYFLENDGHPNGHYNQLVADEIKKFVLSRPDLQRATLRCEHSYKAESFIGPFSFTTGPMTAPPPTGLDQIDLIYYFDEDDCSQGALIGHDELAGSLFLVGHKPWSELILLEPPSIDEPSVTAINPLTRDKEGLAFWVKTKKGAFLLARIKTVQPATYPDLLSGSVPALELEWLQP